MLERVTETDGVVLDIVYATDRVFTGHAVYTRPVAMLLPQARAKLLVAVRLAATMGLRLKIFDAYRPIEAQWIFWHAATDKSFVADPRKGGIHTRGAAVDLTLIDAEGVDLDMGAAFDEFSPRSAHACFEISAEAQRNRALLLGIMTAAGWDNYRLEWWHYQLFDYHRYPPLCASAVPGGPM
jgi:D-alanyl-D-alanine dipeptidase